MLKQFLTVWAKELLYTYIYIIHQFITMSFFSRCTLQGVRRNFSKWWTSSTWQSPNFNLLHIYRVFHQACSPSFFSVIIVIQTDNIFKFLSLFFYCTVYLLTERCTLKIFKKKPFSIINYSNNNFSKMLTFQNKVQTSGFWVI